MAEPFVDAFVAGIYAGDARQLEVASAFPELLGLEQRSGSLLLGALFQRRERPSPWVPRGGTFTFDGGVQVLTDTLAEKLGARLSLGTAVRALEATPAGWRLNTEGGAWEAPQVVVAVPPSIAAELIPAWRGTAALIPASPVAAVHLGWRQGRGPPFSGFGWLSPGFQREDVLGMIGVSATFPHLAPGMDLVRLMIGGIRRPDLALLSDEVLTLHALGVVRQVHGEVPEPELVQISRHIPGIPQYVIGHRDRLTALQGAATGLHPLGWGWTGIGISQGLQAAERLAMAISAKSVDG
jgi:oxygen-dependent protoporphyrinogen oxidase